MHTAQHCSCLCAALAAAIPAARVSVNFWIYPVDAWRLSVNIPFDNVNLMHDAAEVDTNVEYVFLTMQRVVMSRSILHSPRTSIKFLLANILRSRCADWQLPNTLVTIKAEAASSKWMCEKHTHTHTRRKKKLLVWKEKQNIKMKYKNVL